MGFIVEQRASDSPYVETVMHGHTACDGSTIRPAESCWHMVLVKYAGKTDLRVVGPLLNAGPLDYLEGIELLWIRFRLGTFMPNLPNRGLLNAETSLPEVNKRSFWLDNTTWEYPTFDNADTFIDHLFRKEILVHDPLVSAVLENEQPRVAPRTVRHRFLRATGLTQNHIFQVERAQRAATLLQAGMSIADTMFETGYFDQPHLTRSLKQWVGLTPAELRRQSSHA